MKAADWLGRTLLLILAGMATLSIIGAIAAIPGGGPRDLIGPSIQIAEQPATTAASGSTVVAGQGAPAPSQSSWMEPLTYAMIALAGIAAAGLIVLMRIGAHLGTIANRNGL